MKKLLALIVLVLSFSVTSIYAATIPIDSISSVVVGGNQMAGMSVTVNGTSTASWAAGSGNSGGAVSAGNWSLAYDGPNTMQYGSANPYWELNTYNGFTVTSLTIDAYIGNTYFDVFFNTDEFNNPGGYNEPGLNTDGSSRGNWQEISQSAYIGDGTFTDSATTIALLNTPHLSSDGSFSWSFSNPVALNDGVGGTDDPIGDLYGSLTITFANGFNNSIVTAALPAFKFQVDTDWNINREVPEPSTMILFGLGLLGFGAVGRRKNA